MKKSLLALATAATLLVLAGCDSSSRMFDNNCTGDGMIKNPGYCTGTLHPNAGPYAAKS